MDSGEGRHRTIRRNIQVHRCSKKRLPDALDEANEVRNRLPHGRGGVERNGGRGRRAARGSNPSREAARKDTPTKNKGAEGARRGRSKQENKKIERSLTITRKTRQSKESNVGEPRKKGQQAIRKQSAGAAERVPLLGNKDKNQ